MPTLAILLLLVTTVNAGIDQLQLVGTYTNIPVPPFNRNCPEAIRILQVDPITTNQGNFFVISHNNIQLPFQGGAVQPCTSVSVNAPLFSDRSATVLIRNTQIQPDLSNPLVRAFNLAQEPFFLGRELGPRTCGQAVLPADTVSMWVAPDALINVPAGGTFAINFKPGFKYIYYFSETEPCLYRGNANRKGTVQPVPSPPAPTPPSNVQLLSPIPAPSLSPFPSVQGNVNGAVPDDSVTILDQPIESSAPACFPFQAVVQTAHGSKPIGKLTIGDNVLVDKAHYSSVFAFTHATPRITSQFVKINTKNRSLSLSQGHFMYINGRPMPADLVRVGDRVRDVEHGDAVVTSVGMVTKRGLYNPQTVQGDIVVDGLVVTTYTTALGNMMTAHALLAPVRLFRSVLSVDALLDRIRSVWIACGLCR